VRRREYPSAASCNALVVFGLLLTTTSVDRVWRTYDEVSATGWDALGDFDALLSGLRRRTPSALPIRGAERVGRAASR
jgi:hypothetical protein